eukprot:gene27385-33739_t
MMCTLYNCLVLPYVVAFEDFEHQCPLVDVHKCLQPHFEIVNTLIVICYLVDMGIVFRSSYVSYPDIVTDSKAIALHYFKGLFWVDVIAVFPWIAVIKLAFPSVETVSLELLRLLRLLKAQRLFQATESISNVGRLFLLLLGLVVLGHWVGCLWWLVARVELERDPVDEQFTGPPWSSSLNLEDASKFTQWTICIYWALRVLTSVEPEVLVGTLGYVAPATNVERMVCVVFQLMGAVAAGALIGNVVGIVTQMDIVASRYRDKMAQIGQYMEFHRVPKELRLRVKRNAAFRHDLTSGTDPGMNVLKDLPVHLQKELQLQLLGPILQKVDFFKSVSESFLKEVCMVLVQEIFLPGDMVVNCGDLANELYFVSRGQLQVTSGDGKTLFKVLRSGDYFGERMLIDAQPKRSATVQAITYCETYYTKKQAFLELLENFPEYKELLLDDVARKYQVNMKENVTVSNIHDTVGFWKQIKKSEKPGTSDSGDLEAPPVPSGEAATLSIEFGKTALAALSHMRAERGTRIPSLNAEEGPSPSSLNSSQRESLQDKAEEATAAIEPKAIPATNDEAEPLDMKKHVPDDTV